jgi:hypothetical protein
MLSFPQLFLQAAALKELLETAQGSADGLPIMNAHP